MDQKLVLCLSALKDEAEAVRVGAASADLNPLIADVADLCKQAVSDEDVSFVIAVIFDKESGIFSVVESVMTIKDRAVVKARESCCTLVAEFIEQIGERAIPHVPFVKEKCLNLLRRDDFKAVQAAALTPLMVILETSVASKKPCHFHVDMNLAEKLLQEYRKAKTSGTLRANILILLGYLVEYFPDVFVEKDVTNMLRICLDTLEEQLRQAPSLVLVSGVVRCADSLLTWYDDSIPAGGSIENAKKLYTYLKQVICYREDMKRYETVRAGLRLLSRHACRFALRLMQDSKDIFSWLQTYCTHTNAPLRDAGFAAFNQFISQVSWCLVNEENRVHNVEAIYKYFMGAFLDILDTQYRDAKLLLSLAVRGLGKLSPAIVKFSGKETLRQVFHRLIPFGGSTSRSGEDQDYLLGHSDNLIGAFADIVIHLDSVEDFMVSFVAEVTGNIFYQFPQLFPKQKKAICVTLTLLFKALYLKGTIYSIFINNIVWSSLERTMESSQGIGDTSLPLWPQYLELWSNIFECSSQSAVPNGRCETPKEEVAGPGGNVLEIDIKQFQESIFDVILKCLMKKLKELNLKYRVKASNKHSLQDDAEAAGGAEPETELEPLNNLDMQKYLHLMNSAHENSEHIFSSQLRIMIFRIKVEFIQVLLSRPYTQFFLKWVYPFGCCIMELSSRYPLISGQYKLLTITIKNADDWGFFQSSDESNSASNAIKMEGERKLLLCDKPSAREDAFLISSEERERCKLLFRHFLHEVVIASKRYKLELLASCLRLLISAPPALIDIASLIAPMQTALKIGLRYPPLASVAVDALERWHQAYPRELETWLPNLACFLGDYLAEVKTVEVSDVLPAADQFAGQGLPIGEGSTTPNLSRGQLAQMRQTRAKANQPGQFEVTQLRVQKFLGQIGHFNHHLVPKVDLLQVAGTGGLAWDSVDRVQFTFPFKNEKYDVWLDPLLPRVVELAISSSDRSTKVSASEFLQALCLVMLGNSAKGPIQRKSGKSHSLHLDKIYRRLFPAILRLAVDVELVTRQLFNEFAKQLIHWYTSNQQKENPETVALLDAILDGLVDADNGSLREYCAMCLGEFMSWSVRHAPPEANNFVNVKSILRRLYNRMDHPNPYQRLGASMAAFCIYPVLRGTPSIVDRYIFEIFFFCIKSLQLAEGDDNQVGTIKQMNKTLDNYMKLVDRNIDALQQVGKDRPMFLSLEEFLKWLLHQTEQVQEKCRSRCMSLLSFICRLLPVASVAGWFRSSFSKTVTVRSYIQRVDIQLENLSVERTGWSIDEAGRQLPAFIRSLHWFTWALKDNLITTEELRVNTRSGPVVERFLQIIFLAPESNCQWDSMTPGQRESHQRLKCTSIIYLLRFMKQILDIEFETEKRGLFLARDISKTAANIGLLEELIPVGEPKFHEMICLALLRPQDLGFVITDPDKAEELAKLALNVIQMLTVVSGLFKSQLISRLQDLLREDKFDLSQVSLTLENGGKDNEIRLEDAASLIKGYQQLHFSKSLLPVLGGKGKKMGENLLSRVVQIGRECPPALESIASEMLSLSRVLGTTAKKLVEICTDDGIATLSPNARNISIGGIFYLNFRKEIISQVKYSFKECLPMLLSAAVSSPTARLLLNAILDDFIVSPGRGKNMSQDDFLQELLKHLKILQPCGAFGLADKQFLLEIIHKLLLLGQRNNQFWHDLCAVPFIEDTYVSFITGIHNREDDTGSSSQKDAEFALQSQSLMILPLFLASPFAGDFGSRVGKALTRVVSDHLLVRETDLLANSNQRSRYLQMLSRLLEALALSCHLVLLEVVFPLLLKPPSFVVKRLSEMLYKFAENIGEKRQDGFDLCIRLLYDETKLPQLRRAVMEKVFVPLVDMAPLDFVAIWYSERIKGFVDMLGKPPSNRDAEKEEESLVVKICHYSLVEHLFLRVEAPLIKEKITPVVPNAVLIKQTMAESRAKNDSAQSFPENATLCRELHASAYNCLAAIAMRTQEQEKIFSFLFKEAPSTGMIWHHLIDTGKVYDHFPVETSFSNAMSLNVREMRDKRRARIRTHGNTIGGGIDTLSSQYFAGAGLSQEPALIDAFVGHRKGSRGGDDAANLGTDPDTGGNLYVAEEGPRLNESNGTSEAVVDTSDVDQDDFDLHPCMPVVLNLIQHLHVKFGKGSQEMPEWMKGLHSTMQNAATHTNIRLFVTKVVTKCQKVFAPYCEMWFLPTIQTILRDARSSGGTSFHYMLRDICVTILQWNFKIPPDARVASDFINHLMSVAAHGSSQVLRHNVDIIRLFVESWKDHIQLERKIILNYICAGGKAASSSDRSLRTQRIVGLQLLGATVASGLPMHDPVIDHFSEQNLYHGLLQNLNFKGKEVYEAAGELLGMALRQQDEATLSFAPTDKQLLEVPLKQLLLNLVRDGSIDAFLNILNKITLRFPKYVTGFTSILIDMLPKLHGIFKSVALDIFLRLPGCVSDLLNVMLPSLVKLLTHRDEAAQSRALRLLMELLQSTSDRETVETVVPSICETFATHENVDCRQQFYAILINIYERDGINSDRVITRSLLAGLTDSADVIRGRLQTFWHGQLSQDLGERMTQLINEMHAPAVEESWAPFADVLLLKLCEDSVDYKRPIFNAPLSDCEFREQTINTSWLESSLPMTPLFTQSQSVPQSSQDSRSQVIQPSQEPKPGAHGEAGFIRATFTSTIQSQDVPASSVLPSQESALFAMSRRLPGTQREATMLDSSTLDESTISRRRIPTANANRSQVIRAVANANRRREARLAQQVHERGNKVQMMRRYRTGELPDIEIKYEEILAPMAALAERDVTFARLLLTLICRAIYARPTRSLPRDEEGDLKSSMKKGIEKALETTNNGTSFIGCLQSLCLEDPQIWIRPQLVGRAALKSTNFQSGILVLETQIQHAISEEIASSHHSTKRQKGAGSTIAPHKPDVQVAWLELANLYSELGEDDVVLSIYRRSLTTKPITHTALEAQLGGDSSRGLILYDQALDTMENSSGGEEKAASQIEQNIWYNQRLVCLADLNRWQQIVADTLVQIQDEDSSDPDLQRLWDPRVREPYLGLFMRGAVKVATHRPAAAGFVQSSLEDPAKRDVLMTQYGSQLALLAVVDGQLERARFYLSQCYRTFRKQWSTLPQLAVGARHHLVQTLQKLVELDEYIDVVSGPNVEENLTRQVRLPETP